MKRKMSKVINRGGKILLKVLPICAMAMTIINANATACWGNGQDTPPTSLKKYRKF